MSDNLPKQLTDILLRLKKVTQDSIHVAEVGRIIKIDYDASTTIMQYQCELLSSAGATVICDCTLEASENATLGKTVLIVFCDTDFRRNLQRIRKGKAIQATSSEEKHSTAYGIIIGTF